MKKILGLFVLAIMILTLGFASAVECGDGFCEEYEDFFNCRADCPTYCGDGLCGKGEGCGDCSVDCGICAPFCGDGFCEETETFDNCPIDCENEIIVPEFKTVIGILTALGALGVFFVIRRK